MHGMTVKEIAGLANITERGVRKWIAAASELGSIASELRSELIQKAGTGTPNNPVRYSLPAVVAIIRAGGKDTLADLLAENAAQRQALPAPQPDLPAIVREVVRELLPALTAAMAASVQAGHRRMLPKPTTFYELHFDPGAKVPVYWSARRFYG